MPVQTYKADSQDLRMMRAKYALTKEGLAKLMGVNRQTIGRWERGPVPADLWDRMQEVEKALAPPPPPPDRAAGIDKRTLANYRELVGNLTARDRTVEDWHAGQHKNGTRADASYADKMLAVHRQLTGQE